MHENDRGFRAGRVCVVSGNHGQDHAEQGRQATIDGVEQDEEGSDFHSVRWIDLWTKRGRVVPSGPGVSPGPRQCIVGNILPAWLGDHEVAAAWKFLVFSIT